MTDSGWTRLRRVVESTGASMHNQNNQARWNWQCSHAGCSSTHSTKHQKGLDPDVMLLNMRRKGWSVDYGSAPYCALHTPHKTKRVTNGANISAAIEDGEAQMDMKITRDVMARLEESYSVKECNYLDGITDEYIARKCGTTAAIVAGIREQAFGPLKENPELTKLRDDLIMFQLNVEEAQKKLVSECSQLLQRLERIAAKGKEHV